MPVGMAWWRLGWRVVVGMAGGGWDGVVEVCYLDKGSLAAVRVHDLLGFTIVGNCVRTLQ